MVARLYAEQIKSRRDAALADLAQAKADRDTKRAQIDKARSSLAARRRRRQPILRRSATAARRSSVDAQRNLERQTELTRARGRNAERA